MRPSTAILILLVVAVLIAAVNAMHYREAGGYWLAAFVALIAGILWFLDRRPSRRV
jgi:Flp pilus assembly protein protease CpaA